MQRSTLVAAIYVAFAAAACAGGSQGRAPGGEAPSREASAASRNLELGGWDEAFSDVRLAITSPAWGEVVPPGDVPVRFDLRNYEVWAGGAHIHLIVDNEPYIAIYDADADWVVKDLAPGAHVLRAFPSRPWHESIKASPEAFAVVRFVVGTDDGKYPVEKDQPILTYSRPKGAYEGKDAERILFDYYLANVELGEDGHRVRWTLDGDENVATEWMPIWWEGLTPGDHEIRVELLDRDGKPVENGGLNSATRTFTVRP